MEDMSRNPENKNGRWESIARNMHAQLNVALDIADERRVECDRILAELNSLREYAGRMRDIAEAANDNCKQAVAYLTRYRPQLAGEFDVFCKNIDAELIKGLNHG